MRFYFLLIIALQSLSSTALSARHPYIGMTLSPVWHLFPTHASTTEQLIGCSSISLSNHRGNPLGISRFSLSWQPASRAATRTLKPLVPFLYKKTLTNTPLAARNYLAKGFWDTKTCNITFELTEPHKLIDRDDLMLVIHTPPENAELLKQGMFTFNDATALQTAQIYNGAEEGS